MKIAIIGANGFIGSRLVEHYHLTGLHEVVPVVRKATSLALPARFGLEWRIGDALDVVSLTEAIKGCDAVVHAALGDPLQIERMPSVLCASAAAAGASRVVYLSSASVHGQNIAQGTNENSPLHTSHSLPYNNAKVKAERSFLAEAKRHAVFAYALRPGVVYGPRSRWIADLARELRDGRAWLFQQGRGICNSIYVDNLVAAVSAALTAPDGAGEAFLVGDAETVTWADFYKAVCHGIGIPPETIREVESFPEFNRSLKERVDDVVAKPWMQAVLPAVPFRLKRATKSLLASFTPPAAIEAWSLPAQPGPAITEEMALLQQCRWKIPHDKATRLLGYQPAVPFNEAMRRSTAWLKFAEVA